ncbi:unnamed protein product [Colias eurytheme]|nr:unnamed protein product [Colias eurytheme]
MSLSVSCAHSLRMDANEVSVAGAMTPARAPVEKREVGRNIVKCNQCNIVISEVLSFIQNKIDIMDNQSLIQICKSGFSEEDVACAKKLLYQAIPNSKRIINRKNKGKSERELADIIDLFKQTDPELIPVFVARDLQKLPPLTFDHVDVTNLLKNIIILQSEVKCIKDSYATISHVEELFNRKSESQHLGLSSIERSETNINRQRGAFVLDESTYVNLSDSEYSESYNDLQNTEITNAEVTQNSRSMTDAPTVAKQGSPSHSSSHALTCAANSGTPLSRSRDMACAQRVEATAVSTSRNVVNEARVLHPAKHNAISVLQKGNLGLNTCEEAKSWANTAKDGEWKKVERRKNYKSVNRFIGNQGKGAVIPDNKFKAADIKIPFYIYNVDMAATSKDIADYVLSRTQVMISPEKISMKKSKGYEAYKFLIPRVKLPVFMNENIWPEVDTAAGALRGRPYGGVALLWRKSLFSSVSVVMCNSVRIAAIKVSLCDRDMLVFSVYMPTNSSDNLAEFTDCFSEITAIIDSNSIETVFMLGDYNAHTGELFHTELLQICEEQQWLCADIECLPSDSYTFVSDAHGCRRWLDHCITTEAAQQTLVNVKSAECSAAANKPRKYKPVPGWNKHVKIAYEEARWAFQEWQLCGKPDTAENHKSKDFVTFWKNANKLHPRSSLPVSVGGKHDPTQIANMFVDQFKVKPLANSSVGNVTQEDACGAAALL